MVLLSIRFFFLKKSKSVTYANEKQFVYHYLLNSLIVGKPNAAEVIITRFNHLIQCQFTLQCVDDLTEQLKLIFNFNIFSYFNEILTA